MRLSIIIPMYNCGKTIGRLLDSVLAQNWDKDWYEIVTCNDKSTDNTLEVIKKYEDKMNIIHCNTIDRKIHCPGNTRRDALPYASGDWITFIDNDDTFEPNTFNGIWDKIIKDNVKYVLCCDLREWDQELNTPLKEIHRTDTWLHGKFYSRKFLIDNGINFKENLESHEDVFFNSLVLSKLINLDADYIYYDRYVYRWVYRADSLSRIGFGGKYFYIEEYLKDYLAAIEPHLYGYIYYKHKNFYYNQIMMTILHGYFYYQASIWRLGINDRIVKENYNYIKSLVNKIFELGISREDIIGYIYKMPERYANVKRGCEQGSCQFIELESFYTFIMDL